MSMHDKVREFHKVFKLPVAEIRAFPEKNVRELRMRILEEEFNEYYDAAKISDVVNMSDALGDIAYVACGTAVVYGTSPAIPHYSETSFEFLENDCTKYDPKKSSEYYVSKLKKAFADYAFAEALNDLTEVEQKLNNILNVVSEISCKYGIPLQKIFNEIHRSNMSKLDKNGNPIYRADGKVLKSELYSPPNLSQVIAEDWLLHKKYTVEHVKNLIGDNWLVDGF